jgi:hypothetical protein
VLSTTADRNGWSAPDGSEIFASNDEMLITRVIVTIQ